MISLTHLLTFDYTSASVQLQSCKRSANQNQSSVVGSHWSIFFQFHDGSFIFSMLNKIKTDACDDDLINLLNYLPQHHVIR